MTETETKPALQPQVPVPQQQDAPQQPQKPAPSQEPRPKPPREIGGPTGPEPTRYGDWEKNGRCTDF